MESTHFQLCAYIKSAHIHIVSTTLTNIGNIFEKDIISFKSPIKIILSLF